MLGGHGTFEDDKVDRQKRGWGKLPGLWYVYSDSIKRVATKVATYKIKVATSEYDKLQQVTTGISLEALRHNGLDTTAY